MLGTGECKALRKFLEGAADKADLSWGLGVGLSLMVVAAVVLLALLVLRLTGLMETSNPDSRSWIALTRPSCSASAGVAGVGFWIGAERRGRVSTLVIFTSDISVQTTSWNS